MSAIDWVNLISVISGVSNLANSTEFL